MLVNSCEKPVHGGQPTRRKGFSSWTLALALRRLTSSLKSQGFPSTGSNSVKPKLVPGVRPILEAVLHTLGGEYTSDVCLPYLIYSMAICASKPICILSLLVAVISASAAGTGSDCGNRTGSEGNTGTLGIGEVELEEPPAPSTPVGSTIMGSSALSLILFSISLSIRYYP